MAGGKAVVEVVVEASRGCAVRQVGCRVSGQYLDLIVIRLLTLRKSVSGASIVGRVHALVGSSEV